jgi:hypothetical protein
MVPLGAKVNFKRSGEPTSRYIPSQQRRPEPGPSMLPSWVNGPVAFLPEQRSYS